MTYLGSFNANTIGVFRLAMATVMSTGPERFGKVR